MGFSVFGVYGSLGLLYTVDMSLSVWLDEPWPQDDAWFAEVEPGTPDEPEWFRVEWAALYGVVVGG
jgi:hypothetical protein